MRARREQEQRAYEAWYEANDLWFAAGGYVGSPLEDEERAAYARWQELRRRRLEEHRIGA